MKIVTALLFFVLFLPLASQSLSQQSSDEVVAMGNVATTVEVVVSDIPAYIAALKEGQDVFRNMGGSLTGFCEAMTGSEPGEALVFTIQDSMESALAGLENQRTDSEFQSFVANLEPLRERTGSRLAVVIKPYAGEAYETWATRSLLVHADNPEQYLAAVSNLEQVAHDNDYSDFFIVVQQEIASGDNPNLLAAVAVAPSLARLGAIMDALNTADWARTAMADVEAARTLVDDRIYRCEQIYQAV